MTKISRKELYDLVWSKPLTVIAEEVGLTTQMIGTACKKYNVPRPKNGHWQKLEHNKNVIKPDLPELDSEYYLLRSLGCCSTHLRIFTHGTEPLGCDVGILTIALLSGPNFLLSFS